MRMNRGELFLEDIEEDQEKLGTGKRERMGKERKNIRVGQQGGMGDQGAAAPPGGERWGNQGMAWKERLPGMVRKGVGGWGNGLEQRTGMWATTGEGG